MDTSPRPWSTNLAILGFSSSFCATRDNANLNSTRSHNILRRTFLSVKTNQKTTMQFSSRSLLSLAAALVLSTSEAFVQKNAAASFGVPKSASSLNMVADDAKVILVTGSSRGLGKSIATDIGKEGHKIVINYVSDGSKASAEAAVDEIKAAGGDAIAIQADCE